MIWEDRKQLKKMHYTISIVKSTLIVYNKKFVFLFGLKHFRNCWEMLVV